MLLAVIPLPNPEMIPPVTTTYFIFPGRFGQLSVATFLPGLEFLPLKVARHLGRPRRSCVSAAAGVRGSLRSARNLAWVAAEPGLGRRDLTWSPGAWR
jgi:hypothetical protein